MATPLPILSNAGARKTSGAKKPKVVTNEGSKPIMETNSSSIVSKRSVEHLYYDPPHFLRYFVKKRKIRSPLINRGYWLRMQCIEKTIVKFCHKAAGPTLVINLGAGYDALPFRLLSMDTGKFNKTLFLDVDYPELTELKVKAILEEPELCNLLGDHRTEQGPLKLVSQNYWALGCDLHDIKPLEEILSRFITRDQHYSILLISEVATCYMDPSKVDALWKWFSGFEDVTLCLLEQHLPRGSCHPFAETMLKHFAKLKSPLRGLERYSTMRHQTHRFKTLGWNEVQIESLWQFWCNQLSSDEREYVNRKEPFDEWEEFALYACHYFLLIAKTTASSSFALSSRGDPKCDPRSLESNWVKSEHQKPSTTIPLLSRRFGALYQSGQDLLHCHGGHSGDRKNSTVEVSLSDDSSPDSSPAPLNIEPRLCHTATRLNEGFDVLLTGGRASPDRVLSDCWVRIDGIWRQTESLPVPLYRHSAVSIHLPGSCHAILVYGGQTRNGRASQECFLWCIDDLSPKGNTQDEHAAMGRWTNVPVQSYMPHEGRFAAAMASYNGKPEGILLGGLLQSGIPARECFSWQLRRDGLGWNLHLELLKDNDFTQAYSIDRVSRFGAAIVSVTDGYVLIGGIEADDLITQHHQILFLSRIEGTYQLSNYDTSGIDSLLVGHMAAWDGCAVYVVGGGATCFSFGAFNNNTPLKIVRNENLSFASFSSVEVADTQVHGKPSKKFHSNGAARIPLEPPKTPAEIEHVEALVSLTESQFANVLNALRPVVLKGLDFGPCVNLWTSDHLVKSVGANRSVSIHRAQSKFMAFQPGNKNFTYLDCPFGDFMTSIQNGGREYFRALSHQDTSTPTNLASDFPALANEFCLPAALVGIEERLHSSVLRISGAVSMWLHYDVLANILVQIRGTKNLILFPPSDVSYLDVPAGSSSSRIQLSDLLDGQSPVLNHTHPRQVTLTPGDALFIPPLWFHCATPNDTVSVAVNVFFRNMEDGYAAGRDAYGNRDVQAYEEGRRDIAKVIKRLRRLPPAMADFYIRRLQQEFHEQGVQATSTHN